MKKNERITAENFLDMANEVHNNKYEYPDKFISATRNKMRILCLEHGEFFQMLSFHIHNIQGCPHCAKNIQNYHINTILKTKGKDIVEKFIKENVKDNFPNF